jgi:predicted RNase H-like HicB family nuclease
MASQYVSFRGYVSEVLKTARYEAGEDLDCVVAIAESLPGCMTQGESLEEARELLIDAIETWILSAIKDGEPLPELDGMVLAIGRDIGKQEVAYA